MKRERKKMGGLKGVCKKTCKRFLHLEFISEILISLDFFLCIYLTKKNRERKKLINFILNVV